MAPTVMYQPLRPARAKCARLSIHQRSCSREEGKALKRGRRTTMARMHWDKARLAGRATGDVKSENEFRKTDAAARWLARHSESPPHRSAPAGRRCATACGRSRMWHPRSTRTMDSDELESGEACSLFRRFARRRFVSQPATSAARLSRMAAVAWTRPINAPCPPPTRAIRSFRFSLPLVAMMSVS